MPPPGTSRRSPGAPGGTHPGAGADRAAPVFSVAAGERPASLEGLPGRRLGVNSAVAMRENIRLVSSAGTGFAYYTTKNKRTQTNKLELKKYDPVARQHVVFKEAKMPPHSK